MASDDRVSLATYNLSETKRFWRVYSRGIGLPGLWLLARE